MHQTAPRDSAVPIVSSDNKAEIRRLFSRRAQRLEEAERTVAPIIRDIINNRDQALVRYAKRWDGFEGSAATLAVSPGQTAAAWRKSSPDFRRAVREAAKNIREYCRWQMPSEWLRTVRPGIRLGQVVRPLDSVGCYIPGGRFPLPSTVLMTAIPAQVAGVKRIAICTPRPVPEILAVAGSLGIEEVYTVGGAPAVAALAYGTKTIARVSKIVGPGNAYVAAAKRLVSRDVPIDFVAGPTEVLLIADDGNPEWIAADMLAQAEHDVDAAALLLTRSTKLAKAVARAVDLQFAKLPFGSPAAASLRKNCAIVVVRDTEEAISLSNRFAPEHLSIPRELALHRISGAGSIFVGPFSPEAAGDYASGPNHVLPTGGMGAFRGGLSVLDFLKIISVQQLSERGLRDIAPSVVALARSEGLEAHARSVEVRLKGGLQKGKKVRRVKKSSERTQSGRR